MHSDPEKLDDFNIRQTTYPPTASYKAEDERAN
jgi:hypothetical protein